MLTEMARMSLDDGLVMQIHPGAVRNHNGGILARHGRDMGADIPGRTDYVHALKPLLDLFGNEKTLSIILFTLDETTYARELAPLAGHYPVLRLGPAWWFFDSPEGMLRFREQTTETAGFYNTVGFNDDTRAFPSILPATMWRAGGLRLSRHPRLPAPAGGGRGARGGARSRLSPCEVGLQALTGTSEHETVRRDARHPSGRHRPPGL